MVEYIRNNPYILCLVLGLICSILSFIDDKYVSKKKEINILSYLKIMLITATSIGLSIYLVKENSVVNEVTEKINESIHTGNPDF